MLITQLTLSVGNGTRERVGSSTEACSTWNRTNKMCTHGRVGVLRQSVVSGAPVGDGSVQLHNCGPMITWNRGRQWKDPCNGSGMDPFSDRLGTSTKAFGAGWAIRRNGEVSQAKSICCTWDLNAWFTEVVPEHWVSWEPLEFGVWNFSWRRIVESADGDVTCMYMAQINPVIKIYGRSSETRIMLDLKGTSFWQQTQTTF